MIFYLMDVPCVSLRIHLQPNFARLRHKIWPELCPVLSLKENYYAYVVISLLMSLATVYIDVISRCYLMPLVLSNAMQCNALDRIYNLVNVSGVRPASVDTIATLFMDRSSPNLEHSFPVSYASKIFVCSSIGSTIRPCASLNRPSLTAVKWLHQRLP